MLDEKGYRPNVGILLVNDKKEVFWAKRRGQSAWQFPQGGVDPGESLEECLFREIYEEIGLRPEHVKIIGKTKNWLYYDVPHGYIRASDRGTYRGQKQIWFLLHMLGQDNDIQLIHEDKPEFDDWCWHHYWVPLHSVIDFKREIYQTVLTSLAPLVFHPHSKTIISTQSTGVLL
jgi:putative (di)nucleoside polyphosphate hydrolase